MIRIQTHLIAGLALMMSSSTTGLARSGAACLPFTWTTLGTAGGPVPTPDRGEPSNLLHVGDRYILVDSGDGTVNQLGRLGMNLGMVDSVFLSHHHLDHTAGLAAVVGLRWMNDFPGRLTVYGPPGTRELVDGLLASMQPQARIGFGIGRAPAPPEASVQIVEMTDRQQLDQGPLKIIARVNTHFHGEQAKGAPTALSLSYRFDFGDRSITYSGDTGPSQALTMLAGGSDLLVTEIMDYAALAEEIDRQRPDLPVTVRDQVRQHLLTHHLTGEQVGQMARSADVKHVLLTHYAIPQAPLARSAGRLLEGIRANYSGAVHFGRDLGSIDVGCR